MPIFTTTERLLLIHLTGEQQLEKICCCHKLST
uniref:Clone 1511 transcribed RNA sequence n=1 Tax=Plectreurys tristis TaxID=33319 RepID=A0A0C4W4E2_PLETR|nr:hypothetical protein [Plectreurys tristis]